METDTGSVEIVIDDQWLKKRPLSASSLKAFRKSPKHYIEYITKPRESKPEFVVGSALECLILEPEKFEKKFQVYQKFDKRSNKAKEQWTEMLVNAKNSKVELITEEEIDLATRMAESVFANESCMEWLNRKRYIQRKFLYTDHATQLPVVGYIDFDAEVDEIITIVDVKTTVDGEPDKWFRDAAKFEYDIQVGAYLEGYRRKFYAFPDFKFLVVEKNSPNNAYIVNCPGKYLEEAREEFRQTLVAFRYCMTENLFHMGYDFWLFDTLSGFTMQKPRYKRSKFSM